MSESNGSVMQVGEVIINIEIYDDSLPVLCCPACEGEYAHQGRVEVFNRQEDAEEGTHVDVRENKVLVDRNLAGNPSARRHGVRIYFTCEYCDNESVLSILQHKGNTFLKAEYWPSQESGRGSKS